MQRKPRPRDPRRLSTLRGMTAAGPLVNLAIPISTSAARQKLPVGPTASGTGAWHFSQQDRVISLPLPFHPRLRMRPKRCVNFCHACAVQVRRPFHLLGLESPFAAGTSNKAIARSKRTENVSWERRRTTPDPIGRRNRLISDRRRRCGVGLPYRATHLFGCSLLPPSCADENAATNRRCQHHRCSPFRLLRYGEHR